MIQRSAVFRLFRFLLYVVLIAGALLALFGLFAKKEYLIERQITIAAPMELVYDQVRYFRNFRAWSPWAGMDADVRVEGEDGSPGAAYYWSGEGETGRGSMVLKTAAPQRLDFEVTIEEPYRSISPTWFAFEADSNQTRVTWVFRMRISYPWNGLAMFTDVNTYVGKDFLRGLENLKRHCEVMMPRLYAGYEVREQERQEQVYAGFRQVVPLEQAETFVRESLEKLDLLARKRQIAPVGPMVALFWTIDSLARRADIAVAASIAAGSKTPPALQAFTLEGGQYFWIEQQGRPDLNTAQKAVALYLNEKGWIPLPPTIAEYWQRAPAVPDTALWTTRIVWRAAAPPPPPPDSLETNGNGANGHGEQ
ncbi:MAG: SRPBCC family protein [Saprospiraceae bacterium]|nr:SRPBCC family protein [Saprospiraceae bacterium]MDW8230365.1 SRPBCC family protein [Saprospiraceae bacterium]